jgi:hypothetical protein
MDKYFASGAKTVIWSVKFRGRESSCPSFCRGVKPRCHYFLKPFRVTRERGSSAVLTSSQVGKSLLESFAAHGANPSFWVGESVALLHDMLPLRHASHRLSWIDQKPQKDVVQYTHLCFFWLVSLSV